MQEFKNFENVKDVRKNQKSTLGAARKAAQFCDYYYMCISPTTKTSRSRRSRHFHTFRYYYVICGQGFV
jgi:hypothetical protein